jgi:hypothetical protein
MEVHAHTHTPRKKWTHYFWEFLMLFLAVFCGFLAEYQLEHKIEKEREKSYIKSLVEDLKQDTSALRVSVALQGSVCKMIDTLIADLKSSNRNNITRSIYLLARKIPYSEGRFSINNRTFDQMRTSGNLRLIRNPATLDSITAYYHDAFNASVRGPQEMNFENRHDLFLVLHKLFDAAIFQQMMQSPNPLVFDAPAGNPPLLTNDPIIINEVCTRYHFMYGTKRVMILDNERLMGKADRLIRLIQKTYNLK